MENNTAPLTSSETALVDTAPYVRVLQQTLMTLPYEAQVSTLRYLFDWVNAARLFETPPPVVEVFAPQLPAAPYRGPEPPEPAVPSPPPLNEEITEELPEVAQDPNEDLVAWVGAAPGRKDALTWLANHLEGKVGQELRLAELHAVAKQAGAPIGCPARTSAGKPADCDGRLSNCGLKLALQILAADPDFPLSVLEQKRGPWGPTYRYMGFGS